MDDTTAIVDALNVAIAKLNAPDDARLRTYLEKIRNTYRDAPPPMTTMSLKSLLPPHEGSLRISRSLALRIARHVVTADDLLHNMPLVVRAANAIGGPQIHHDPDRRCLGLFADRDYEAQRPITLYGGTVYHHVVDGDYVARLGTTGALYVDGAVGFTLEQKGRWINESDGQRTVVNVELGRTVRTLVRIREGEQLFADYGDEYMRTY